MRGFVALCKRLNYWFNTVAEVALFVMLMFTVLDVVLRSFGKPIVGTYELVAVLGAIVIGFAVPQTSWDRGHVFVDFLIENRSPAVKNGWFIGTRLVGIFLYGFLSYAILMKGIGLYKAHEVSLTLHIPYYPAAYALSLCFFVEVLCLITDIFRIYTEEGKA